MNKFVVGEQVKVKSGIYSGLEGTVSKIEPYFTRVQKGRSKKRKLRIHVRTSANRKLEVDPQVLEAIPVNI